MNFKRNRSVTFMNCAIHIDHAKCIGCNMCVKRAGFSSVFDVNVGADLTAIVDCHEMLEMHEQQKGPLFTSCCPAWVMVAEKQFPDLLPQISSARSCVEMLGQLVKKTHKDAFVVELMPCVAKKAERQFENTIDCCLTVVELI